MTKTNAFEIVSPFCKPLIGSNTERLAGRATNENAIEFSRHI